MKIFSIDPIRVTEYVFNESLLAEYCMHTKNSLGKDGFKSIEGMEKNMRMSLEANAILAIDCLRLNNMYEF